MTGIGQEDGKCLRQDSDSDVGIMTGLWEGGGKRLFRCWEVNIQVMTGIGQEDGKCL